MTLSGHSTMANQFAFYTPRACWSCLLIMVLSFSQYAIGQDNSAFADQQVFQAKLLDTYHHLKATGEERAHLDALKSLPFFPFDSTLVLRATLDTMHHAGYQPMKTSKGRLAMYRKFGQLTFQIAGKSFTMPVYQEKRAADAGRDELFFPFTDLTNGETTYGGGRYIDLQIPKGNTLILNFNRAFNPYCAYSHVYSCEIPPAENDFPIKIEAGIKYIEQ